MSQAALSPTLRETLNRLGGTLGNSQTKDYVKWYGCNFTAVAAGAVGQTQPIKIDAGLNFVAKAIFLDININSGVTITGLPAGFRPGIVPVPAQVPAADAALWGQGQHFTVSFQSSSRPYMNVPIRASQFMASRDRLFWLPDWLYLAGNDQLNVTLINNLPVLTGSGANQAVDAQFALVGLVVTP